MSHAQEPGAAGGPHLAASHRRLVAVALLTLALLVASSATLAAGRLGVPPAQQPAALWAMLHGDAGLILQRLRGPRLAAAAGAGMALGMAGALFQRATANPLVTPDVLGISAAAGAGTAVAAARDLPPALGAALGALVAALVVHQSTSTGFRRPAAVILAGIGVAAAATAVTQYVLITMRREDALALASALTGSLNARTWEQAALAWAATAVLGSIALALRADLDLLALGDDCAHGLGSRPALVRTVALVTGILLTAAAVACAGPILFVALTAPHLARWATGCPAMGSAGLVGGLTVVAADLAVQHLPALRGLPVGILTAGLGGLFLGGLLAQQMRKGSL